MSVLLQIKYRAFLSRLDNSIVGSAGDESHQDAIVRHAFYAGAEAQREVFEDNEQAAAINACRPDTLQSQYFIVGAIAGIIISACVFLIITA
jgi:hypothetical protein